MNYKKIKVELGNIKRGGAVTDEQIANALNEYFAKNPVKDGESGGYYKPFLANDGTLMFTPSKSDMPPLGSVGNVKGKDGYTPQKGVDYFDGVDGYTPQKGIDYFDGKDGDKGDNGGYYRPYLTPEGHLVFTASEEGMLEVGDLGRIKGTDGRGIATIERINGTGLPGTTDTYKITFTDESAFTFDVYNGKDSKSVYEYAKEAGYEGTEEEFAEKLAANPDWIATKKVDGGEETYISQQTLTSGMWSKLQMNFQVDLDYDVYFNGEVYVCRARNEDGGIYLGNVTLMNSTSTKPHNNEPFCIYWAGAGATAGFFYKSSTVSYPITLKVTSHADVVYNKMPKEYLPEEAALKTDINVETITIEEIDAICGANNITENDGNVEIISMFSGQNVSYDDGTVSVTPIFDYETVAYEDGNVTIKGV